MSINLIKNAKNKKIKNTETNQKWIKIKEYLQSVCNKKQANDKQRTQSKQSKWVSERTREIHTDYNLLIIVWSIYTCIIIIK